MILRFIRKIVIFIIIISMALFIKIYYNNHYNVDTKTSLEEQQYISMKPKESTEKEEPDNIDLMDNSVQEVKEVAFTYRELPGNIMDLMVDSSWNSEAPMTLEELSYLKVEYWGFDDKPHIGELVVNTSLAKEVTEIFKELYDAKFPIEKIRLIDEYEADDNLSMSDNNSSAFCFRSVDGSNGVISKHGYGVAIDINPVQNPYVKDSKVLPSNGIDYIDRDKVVKGMITKGDPCYNAFIKRGWTWGGEWNSLKDYQHFEK